MEQSELSKARATAATVGERFKAAYDEAAEALSAAQFWEVEAKKAWGEASTLLEEMKAMMEKKATPEALAEWKALEAKTRETVAWAQALDEDVEKAWMDVKDKADTAAIMGQALEVAAAAVELLEPGSSPHDTDATIQTITSAVLNVHRQALLTANKTAKD